MSVLIVTLDSDPDEEDDVPDLLKECTNQSTPINERYDVMNHSDSIENKPQM